MPDELCITREMVDNMTDKECVDLIHKYLDMYEEGHPMHALVDQNNIYQDIMDATRHKRNKQHILHIIGSDYENILDNADHNMLLKTIRNVQLLLVTESFVPKKHKPVMRWDTKNGKAREMVRPDFQDETIIHHALMRMIMPELTKGMYAYTCASIPNRGVHYVRRHLSRVISNDPKNTKYVLKMDIRKFFNSISHRVLKQKIRDICKDEMLRKLLFRVIDSTKKGVPLGFYTSGWFANFYLQELDHYIKERILVDCGCNVERTGRYGAQYYFRYMDDMVILGPNKKELHKMRARIMEVLHDDLGLDVRPDWQVFRLDYIDKKTGERKGRPIDYVGFQFYHDRVTIRKSTYKRMKKLINRLIKKGIKHVTFNEAASMLSYYGFIYWSDAKGIYTKLLRPHIKLRDLKRIVKKETKRREEEIDRIKEVQKLRLEGKLPPKRKKTKKKK